MIAIIRAFTGAGDTILKEYDPELADMQEVNRFIDQMEVQYQGRAFDLNTGEAVNQATPQNADIAIVPQWCGG